ncbi:hypothetical protein MMC13_002826 [Lambiella insularis]|nr:hypothetical protein [Lambiella insularis]
MTFSREILDLELVDSLVKRESSPGQWFALAKQMRREWFSRRWVVQELAMAKAAYLYTGDDSLHWDDFAEAVALFAREFDKVANLFKDSREFRHDPKFLGDVRALGANSIVDTKNSLFRMSESPEVERLIGLETLVSSLLIFEASVRKAITVLGTKPKGIFEILHAYIAIA